MLKRFLYIFLKSFGLGSFQRHEERSDVVIQENTGMAALSSAARHCICHTILVGCLLLGFTDKAHSALNIQVSIKPIHSIAAFICQGVLEPGLLMTGQESPHTQALTPQQLQALQQADLVIWIGPEYESRWQQPLSQQVKPEKILTLMHAAGLTLYPYRQQGPVHTHACEHGHDHSPSFNDGHIWLDIDNAKVIAQTIAQTLIKLDPSHKGIYQRNLSMFLEEITALATDLSEQLGALQNKFYLIYHDGMQYLDRRYRLQTAASLVAEPDYPPNAQDLLRLKSWLTTLPPEQKPACVFTEPGFEGGIAQNLAAEFGLKCHMVDYIGYEVLAGPQAYFLMMRQLAADLLEGLS